MKLLYDFMYTVLLHTVYRSLLLMVLVPAGHNPHLYINLEHYGFIITTIVQLVASYVLYLALHHETEFRSSGMCMCV